MKKRAQITPLCEPLPSGSQGGYHSNTEEGAYIVRDIRKPRHRRFSIGAGDIWIAYGAFGKLLSRGFLPVKFPAAKAAGGETVFSAQSRRQSPVHRAKRSDMIQTFERF